MSQHSTHDLVVPWTPEEDAILITCWSDPNIDHGAIAKLIAGRRTVEAIKQRGYKIGLGQKAQRKKTRKSSKKSMAWPADMPNFEDHPRATAPGSPARAAMHGSRFRSFGRNSEASLTGSSLEGASPQGLLVDD